MMFSMRTRLAIGVGFSLFSSPALPQDTSIGMITYWGPKADQYEIIPDGALAVLNPDNGILKSRGQTLETVSDIDSWQSIITSLKNRNVTMLGYVPTGYFNHHCNEIGKCQKWERIEKQVEAYFSDIDGIGGIFFDEAAPSDWSCDSFVEEYARLRAIIRKYSSEAQIAFNAGVPDNCVVNGVISDEIAVLFEGSPDAYISQAERLSISAIEARSKGAKVWHLVHTVASQEQIPDLYALSQVYGAQYFYLTLNSGDWESGVNTWGR